MDSRKKEAVQKAGVLLDEGLKALEMQRKHIKVANCSDESHPLAEDSDDEKSEKAEMKAEPERAANKLQRGGGSARNKRKCWPGPA